MMRSKPFVLTSLMAVALMVGCSTLTTAEREAKKAEWKAFVVKCIDDRHYKIDVNMMNPRRGTSKMLSSSWSLEVTEDGYSSIDVHPRKREDISFSGQIVEINR